MLAAFSAGVTSAIRRHHAALFVLGALTIGLSAGGCRDQFGPGTPPVVLPAGEPLAGTRWCVVQIEKSGGQAERSDPGSSAWLSFDSSGRMHGFSGCNYIEAAYETHDSTLTVRELAGTDFSCASNTSFERDLLGGLDSMRTYHASNDLLTIGYSDGGIRGEISLEKCSRAITGATPIGQSEIRARYDQDMAIPEQALTLRVADIIDKRCAIGVHCIQAGDAIVTLNVSIPGTSKQMILHTNAADGNVADTLGNVTVTLVALEPYPSALRTAVLEKYVATLAIGKI